MGDVVDWIRDAWRRLVSWIHYVLFGYGTYGPPDWHWEMGKHRWIYTPSRHDPKGYVCSEYAIARIESRGPHCSGPLATNTDAVIARLGALNWIERPEGCNCGCGAEQCHDCVVVYWEGGMVQHVAVFDRANCDWGGKLGAALPIARYRRPEDYYPDSRVPAGAQMRFFCPRRAGEAGGPPGTVPDPQQPDRWIHDHAVP